MVQVVTVMFVESDKNILDVEKTLKPPKWASCNTLYSMNGST